MPITAGIRIPLAALNIQAKLSPKLPDGNKGLFNREVPGPISVTVRLGFSDLIANSVAD